MGYRSINITPSKTGNLPAPKSVSTICSEEITAGWARGSTGGNKSFARYPKAKLHLSPDHYRSPYSDTAVFGNSNNEHYMGVNI